MNKLFYILFLAVIFSCSQSKTVSANQYNNDTQCVRDNMDGTIVVKSWGTGANINEAVKMAKKRALNDVMFLGITYGKSDCGVIPLVNEPNAKLKHESYFNNFFSENGTYQNYVELVSGANAYKNEPIPLKVKKSELKQKLINDGIIKN